MCVSPLTGCGIGRSSTKISTIVLEMRIVLGYAPVMDSNTIAFYKGLIITNANLDPHRIRQV